MGHIGNGKEEVYGYLAERLNKNPVGAPVNETLMNILYRLYTESEAMVGSKFPMMPMTLDKIAGITGMAEGELKQTLESMSTKGLTMELTMQGVTYYMLAPMMIGFFEFTFMRVRDDINMKELAELFSQYLHTPGVWEEFFGGDTKLLRTMVYERLIPALVDTEVLSYERSSEIIRQSGGGALGMCACRHRASHLGKSCAVNGPVSDVCTSFAGAAEWLIRRGMARPASVDELLRVLDLTTERNLVHLMDNVLDQPAFLCHCCGCCCVALNPARKNGKLPAQPSNFIPSLDRDACSGCGTCAESCQISVIAMSEDGSGSQVPKVNEERCLGCGVCSSSCPTGALIMSRRPDVYAPPMNKMELLARIGKERGKT
jgi:NAD-dependent dihydropyrimidine dehydrogenase PreA subunit